MYILIAPVDHDAAMSHDDVYRDDNIPVATTFLIVWNKCEKFDLYIDVNMAAKDITISGTSEDAMMVVIYYIDKNLLPCR